MMFNASSIYLLNCLMLCLIMMPQRQSITFFNEVVPKFVSEIFPYLFFFFFLHLFHYQVKKITAV